MAIIYSNFSPNNSIFLPFFHLFGTWESWIGSIVANIVGGLIFYWVDGKMIFNSPVFEKPVWEVQETATCSDCGLENIRGYRLVYTHGYDKIKDPTPKYRCEACSILKYKKMYL